MKQWSWEILPCQDDRQVLEWSKKVIIPKKSKPGLNITHDASHDAALPSSLLILRENIDRKKKKKNHTKAAIQAAARAPTDFHLNNQW